MPFVPAIYDEEGGGVGNNTKADTTAKVRIYAVNHLHAQQPRLLPLSATCVHQDSLGHEEERLR